MQRLIHCCRLLARMFSVSRVTRGLALLALAFLGFVCGAAAMYFHLPTSAYLNKSFTGGEAWFERESATPLPQVQMKPPRLTEDKPAQTFDGFTLYTTTEGCKATLLDMSGNVVHQWQMPFSKVWSNPPHVRHPQSDGNIYWAGCHLYPNGDLLAIYQGFYDTPYGYGLVKLDKSSKVLWKYSANVHHDLDVTEDGCIYTLTQELVNKPPDGMPTFPVPYIAEYLVVLSPAGQELKKIPLLEAFRDSPFALVLTAMHRADDPAGIRAADIGGLDKGDVLHANSVHVLRSALAPKFPLFKAGQVLISFRELDHLAMVDVSTRSVVWAAAGLWRGQHDAQFLDNGRLLIFDNLGSLRGFRVLEYDPISRAIGWSYPKEDAPVNQTALRGNGQRLPNGNTLIVDPSGGSFQEVTANHELVWECFCLETMVAENLPPRTNLGINCARRYGPKELTFLNGWPPRGRY